MSLSIKKIKKIVFSFALLIFLLVGSIYQLPYNSVLRWLIIIILLVLIMIENNKNLRLPSKTIILFIPYMTTFFLVSDRGILYSIERSISFLLTYFTLLLLFQDLEQNELKEYLENIGMILNIVTVLNFAQFVLTRQYISFSGIYANQNYLVTILIISLIFEIYFIQSKKSKVNIVFAIINIILLVLSGSRAGIVCLIVVYFSIPLFFYRNNSVKSMLKIFIEFFVLIILGILIIRKYDIQALDRIFAEKDTLYYSTGLSRGNYWTMSIPIFKTHPLFGWGINISYLNINNLTDCGNIYDWGFHNSYLIILCETGIVGTFCFLYYIFNSIIQARKSWLYSIETRLLIIGIIVVMINAFAESFLFAMGNVSAFLFWTLIACLNNSYFQNNTK